ncbi:hypothetical protein [Confluentibacter sediminis]|uniref:hypothetical protein n=1 Tax=Confluentibacter sediminis TaxID=2219045 RepID=UPI000DAD0BCB|nr:hypothetical protein [Confluentibacter sediminis]
MKHTCYIDACSYINLSQDDCYINGKTLLNLLSNEVNLKFSNEVNREIARHHNSFMPDSHERASKVYKLSNKKIKTYVDYEQRLFVKVSNTGDSDRGEKYNLIACLDDYLANQRVGLIYLTDDSKAINGILNDSIFSFPIIQIWNSFDVILFLLMRNNHFGIDIAEAAIRDINAELGKSSTPSTSHVKTQRRITIFKEYVNKAKMINKVLKR